MVPLQYINAKLIHVVFEELLTFYPSGTILFNMEA